MTILEAKESLKIIREKRYVPNPLEHSFLKDIEIGKRFKGGQLSENQTAWLKSIYAKATNPKGRI